MKLSNRHHGTTGNVHHVFWLPKKQQVLKLETANKGRELPCDMQSYLAEMKQEMMFEMEKRMEDLLHKVLSGKSKETNVGTGSKRRPAESEHIPPKNTGKKDECVLVLKPSENVSLNEDEFPKLFSDVVKSVQDTVGGDEITFCKPRADTGSIVIGFANKDERA